MQTFLPYPDFKESLKCLDNERLGKQRVESSQLITAIQQLQANDIYIYDERYDKYYKRAWINHPCTKMWKNNVDALKLYHNYAIEEWVARGFKNTMKLFDIIEDPQMPKWLGNDKFHHSHQSNLLRKNPEYYSKFNWDVPDDLPYIWPYESDLEAWFRIIHDLRQQ